MSRATSLSPHDIFLLDQWGRQLYEAFDETPYLVGSVARAEREWRDVDLRLPLADDAWPFSNPIGWRALNLAVSLWGRQTTALPIDFQFQRLSDFQAADGPANPMGTRATDGWTVLPNGMRRQPDPTCETQP